MRIVGIDLSSHAVDCVSINVEGPHDPVWRRADLQKHGKDTSWTTVGRVKRAMVAADLIGSYWDDVAQVVFEDPFSFGPQVAKALALHSGAVRSCLPDRLQAGCVRLSPQEWKKLAGLRASSSKEDVALKAIETLQKQAAVAWPAFGWPQDAYDAYLVAVAGRNLCHQHTDGAAA